MRALCAGSLDVLTFTSAPAVHALLDAARLHNLKDELLAALQSSLCTVAVGPVTAAPLRALGIEPLVPERHRMGAMIRTLVEHLGANGSMECVTVLGLCQLRGDTVHLEGVGEHHELGDSQLRIFKALLAAGEMWSPGPRWQHCCPRVPRIMHWIWPSAGCAGRCPTPG